jgi:uncharacterized membrane protein (UPF0127 family)
MRYNFPLRISPAIENGSHIIQTAAMRLAVLILSVLLCGACVAQGPSVVLKGQRFSVELAETSDKQALGLMFRDELPKGHGMLFIFPGEGMRSFWMKNTRIPLDILYFDAKLRLVSMAQQAQPCHTQRCPSYRSEGPAKYVLEINGGKAADLGVQPGDVLKLDID